MNNNVWKSKRLWMGIFFFVGLLIASFLYSYYGPKEITKADMFMYDQNGKLVDRAPFSPLEKPPFGSDRTGMGLGWKVLDGAKYTISIVFITAFLQVSLSILIGFLLALYVPRAAGWIRTIFSGFYYIPTIVWVLLFSMPIFISLDPSNAGILKAIFQQMLIFVGIFLPTLSVYICNEVLLLLKEDYVISSRILGASRWYLIRKHLFPALRQKVLVLFLQQSSQMMLLLVQLGFFDLFLGGRNEDVDINTGEVTYTSLSNEWAGLIGGDRNEIWLAPWIILVPLCMFAISIFMLNRMVEGISDGLVEDRTRSQGMKMLLVGRRNQKLSA